MGEKMKPKAAQILVIALLMSSVIGMTNAAQVSIQSDKDEIVELETVEITVTAPINHTITVSSNWPEYTIFPGGVNDNPESDTPGFDDVITQEEPIKKYTVYFTNARDYRVKVVDTNSSLEDYVDIDVCEKEIWFDVPTTNLIGDVLNIKGETNTGSTVDIAIEGVVPPELNDIPIDDDNTFGAGIDTGAKDALSTLKKSGSVRLEGFIDREEGAGTIASDEYDDGATVIMMVSPGLAGEISQKVVARGDDFTISGTGVRQVEILIIAPKGCDGRGIDRRGDTFPGCSGITYYKLTPSVIDHSFSEKINVDYDAYCGMYFVMMLNYGADGIYGDTDESSIIDAVPDLRGGTQDNVMALISDCTVDIAGSDDLIWFGYVKVESPYVNLNPIEGVRVGDALVVTGICNRKDGAIICVTVEGPVELSPCVVEIENGEFVVAFDTSDAEAGTYTVCADDGEGNTDMVTVEIFPEMPEEPTPTPTSVEETPTKVYPSEPGEVSVYLHGEKTDVTVGEDIILSLSAVNLITKPTMTLQLILKVPSGMSITSTEFVESGMGQYTATYTVEPGKGRPIGVNIKTNQVGEFNVEGDICYYFGDDKSTVEYRRVVLPVKVNPISTPTPTGTKPTPSPTETPGFELIFTIVGLLAVAYLVGGRK